MDRPSRTCGIDLFLLHVCYNIWICLKYVADNTYAVGTKKRSSVGGTELQNTMKTKLT